MNALPSRVTLVDVGPRDGLQNEKQPVAAAHKIELVHRLQAAGLREIEVTSFVSPKWVPQMADAEQVVEGIRTRPGTVYTGIYLNSQGMVRALKTGKLTVLGKLSVTASETFSRRNTNRTIEETLAEAIERIEAAREWQVPITEIGVMAAFGCNYEGDIDPANVVDLVGRLLAIAQEHELPVQLIQLADTMGWANPNSIRRLVGMVRDRWPDYRINLHLHDTRGLGLANAIAAMEMGVDDFDAAVAGLGGCPYAGFKDAPGNIATEDLVHLCAEMGVETGIDLDRIVEIAREAETIVGHPLPGKVMRGGHLASYRRKAAQTAAQ